jgi:hypothetical protein
MAATNSQSVAMARRARQDGALQSSVRDLPKAGHVGRRLRGLCGDSRDGQVGSGRGGSGR